MIRIDERTHVIGSHGSEDEAVSRLRAAAHLPGACWAVGMPHLQPGKAHPVGAAVLSDGIVYPHLVGRDIGCGVALFQTDVPVSEASLDRFERCFEDLGRVWEGYPADWLERFGVRRREFSETLGTIGGKHRFPELLAVDAALDGEALRGLGVEPTSLLVLVHDGSRELGERILRAHVAFMGAGGLPVRGEQAAFAYGYLEAHDEALGWARAHRALIAHRIATALGSQARPLLDVVHNAVLAHDGGWLHRNGAAPHDSVAVPIHGSRGEPTYLVQPLGDGTSSGFCLAHGAVVCNDEDLLSDQPSDARPRIERIVTDLVEEGICRVVATLSGRLLTRERSR